jgi:hypothetical protein
MTVTIGAPGLESGGTVKLALPNNGWSEPLTPYLRGCPEIYRGDRRQYAGWAPCNTTLRVESSEKPQLYLYHRNSQNVIGKYDNWSWWITVVVENGRLNAGDRIIITYGDDSSGEEGARVQSWAERNRVYFSAFIDRKGKGEYVEIEGSPVECTVVAGEVERCAFTIPSITRPGERFQSRLTPIDCGHDPVQLNTREKVRIKERSGLEHQFPSPFSGSMLNQIKGLSTQTDNSYSIEVNTGSKVISGRSNPTRSREGGLELYWGDLHCHSFYHMYNPKLGYGHPCTSPVELIEYARDVSHLDFVALTDGRGALPDNAGWGESQQAVIDNYSKGSFVTLKGWEVQFGKDGHRNVIYREAVKEPHIDVPEFQEASVWNSAGSKGMWSALEYYRGRRDVMLIPHHPMAWMNWDVYDPELDRLVEIYSCWGSSEYRHNHLWNKASPHGHSVRHALRLGHKVGFVGGSDSHTGYVGRSIPDGDRYKFIPFKAGFTAVWCEKLSREAIFDALQSRSCYASTGERIVIEFWVDDHFMGSDISEKRDRHSCRFSILGTDLVRYVEIIRDGESVFSTVPNKDSISLEWEDRSRAAKTAHYYYLKAVQADGNTAWASPVWV